MEKNRIEWSRRGRGGVASSVPRRWFWDSAVSVWRRSSSRGLRQSGNRSRKRQFTSSGCAYVSIGKSFPRPVRPVGSSFDTSPHRLRSAAAAAMMLRAARAAGPLLRLSNTGAVGERIRGGVPSTPAVFTRGFLDFFKVGALAPGSSPVRVAFGISRNFRT